MIVWDGFPSVQVVGRWAWKKRHVVVEEAELFEHQLHLFARHEAVGEAFEGIGGTFKCFILLIDELKWGEIG